MSAYEYRRGTHVAGGERQIGDRLVAADVRQRALVRVLERLQLRHFLELLLQALLLRGQLLRCELLRRQRLDVLLDLVLLGDLAEDTGEVGALLRGDLGSGRVGCRSAIAKSEDAAVGDADHAHVLVHDDTAAVILSGGEVAHQVLGEFPERVTLSQN